MQTISPAVRSLRILSAINRRQALAARQAGQPALREHHLQAARDFRASAQRIQLQSAG